MCEASGAKTPVSVVPVVSKPSFSAVVAEQNVSADIPVVHDANALPNRPLTTFFTPQVRLPASEVFCAFRESNVNSSDVSCLQHTSNGQVVVTFRRAECKELFLHRSVLNVAGQPCALQDVDRPLTNVVVSERKTRPFKIILRPPLCFGTTMPRGFEKIESREHTSY